MAAVFLQEARVERVRRCSNSLPHSQFLTPNIQACGGGRLY